MEYTRKIYADFYRCPAKAESPVIYDYSRHQLAAGRLSPFAKVRLSEEAAGYLAARSPYPDGVKLGVMKQVANNREITLSQMRILLGWAARRAQHTGHER